MKILNSFYVVLALYLTATMGCQPKHNDKQEQVPDPNYVPCAGVALT